MKKVVLLLIELNGLIGSVALVANEKWCILGLMGLVAFLFGFFITFCWEELT